MVNVKKAGRGSSYYLELLAKNNIELKPNVDYVFNVDEMNRNIKLVKSSLKQDLANRLIEEKVIAEMTNKTCCICKESKPSNQFSVCRQKLDGLDPRCKPCKSKQVMAYRKR